MCGSGETQGSELTGEYQLNQAVSFYQFPRSDTCINTPGKLSQTNKKVMP